MQFHLVNGKTESSDRSSWLRLCLGAGEGPLIHRPLDRLYCDRRTMIDSHRVGMSVQRDSLSAEGSGSAEARSHVIAAEQSY